MLKGLSVPLTSKGSAGDATTVALLRRLHRHRILGRPGRDRSTPPARPDPRPKVWRARLFFWFLDWQFTGSNDELTDPARYQYREAFVLVEAIFDGMPINYCPYIFVDNDAALARGWAQGLANR
jgi:Acetoacetate decarboxylase (ADC)